MTAELDSLRTASRRLALQFAALIIALFLVMAAVVIGLVAATQHQALVQQLLSAEHLDSPRDAPPDTYVAIVGPQGTQTSDNAPQGFPDPAAISRVSASGGTVQQTKSFGGESFIVRTDGDSGRVVQVAVDRRASQDELRRVVLALALAGIPAVIGAALVAWWMSVRAMRPLADALALQRRFVADAGHELRTPLTLLSTRAQILRRAVGGRPPKADAAPLELSAGLDELVLDAKALTGILEDLLIAADPRRDVERVDVNLSDVATEAVATLRSEAGARGVEVSTDTAVPVLVRGVRVSLSRVVVALVSNALDHARSRVTVTVRAVDKWAVLEVGDDGAGFPPGAAEHAFERFASDRSGEQSGTGRRHYGLGLALVAEVAHRHGGDVEIGESSAGGALVRVRLPLLARS